MNLLIFIVVLSVLVLVHEAGHFFAAKLLKIKVEEFAFGLPFTPAILSIKRGETKYSVYPLFFGGFVKLHGEEEEGADKKRSFWNRNKRQRLLVILAGIVMNIILALVTFIVVYSVVGVPVRTEEKITVVNVAEGSPAQTAGMVIGDRIVAIEGKKMSDIEEFGNVMKSWGGMEVNVTVESGKGTVLFEGIAQPVVEEKVVQIVPRKNPPVGEGAIGVVVVKYPYLQTENWKQLGIVRFAGLSIKQGVVSTGEWMGRIVDGLRQIGKSLIAGKAPEGVSGPVGIYQLTGIVAAEGWLPLMELLAILSVNLAVFNILPIPALDGGRAFFIYLEALTRKRVPAAVEAKINTWGMIFLLTLMALISLQDVLKLQFVSKLLGK